MVIDNLQIVTLDRVIRQGYILFKDGKIVEIKEGSYQGKEDKIDGNKKIAMPGFIDVHVHGSCGIDFMDASVSDIKIIAKSLYEEGVTSFLATTLTSDKESLGKVCRVIKEAKKDNPSLLGIHFEGPYICQKYKGAQNEAFIRNPDIEEFDFLNKESGNNVKYITLSPENDGAMEFISHLYKKGVVLSAGHSDASFTTIEEAIKHGLTNTTHTHNAMSGHHHRNPGIVTAAMYFDSLYCELIADGIHVCPNTIKTFYKIVGPDRLIVITDALKAKHSSLERFQLFGLDCEKKNGAAYLLTGPLAGSLLSMDQALRNMKEYVKDISLIDLAKITSYNAAKSLHLEDRGELKVGKLADFVLLDEKLNVQDVYKLGDKVF